jgi:hypothetical protein
MTSGGPDMSGGKNPHVGKVLIRIEVAVPVPATFTRRA